MDITHAIIIESYHKCRMVKFQRWGRILDLEVEFITPTHDLFFLHFFTLERMSDIVLWHSNFYFYFITLHALYSAKGDITFLAGKKVIKIVYLCNTIKFSIVVRCSFFWGGGESKFCKWDLLQSVKFCLTFLLPDPTPQDVEDEEEDDYIDELFCVACNKAFKSERA